MTGQTNVHGLKLREVTGTDHTSISACAKTLSRAFSADPLLVWLYRSITQPWGALDKKVLDWQKLRIRQSTTKGLVLALFAEGATTEGSCAGLMIIYPGQSRGPSKWSAIESIGQQLARLKSWILWEPTEPCCDPNRLNIMHERHEQILAEHANDESVWYLEAIAIDPAYQGRGVGKVLMDDLVQRVGTGGCVLECTAESTVTFYNRFGFHTVEVVELVDEADKSRRTNLWVMMRSGVK